jgi:hypothetical protein
MREEGSIKKLQNSSYRWISLFKDVLYCIAKEN